MQAPRLYTQTLTVAATQPMFPFNMDQADATCLVKRNMLQV